MIFLTLDLRTCGTCPNKSRFYLTKQDWDLWTCYFSKIKEKYSFTFLKNNKSASPGLIFQRGSWDLSQQVRKSCVSGFALRGSWPCFSAWLVGFVAKGFRDLLPQIPWLRCHAWATGLVGRVATSPGVYDQEQERDLWAFSSTFAKSTKPGRPGLVSP